MTTGGDARSMRRLTSHPSPGPGSSLWHYTEYKSAWEIAVNFLRMQRARYTTNLEKKNRLYRKMGATIGDRVAVGLEATLDIIYPELIEIGDDTIVGYNATILTHEFLTDELRTGPVEIGSDVMIGANTTILPGVTIEDGTDVSAMSLVNRDVSGTVGGVPARSIGEE